LAELATPRLLAYRKRLLALERAAELSDLDPIEVANLETGYVYFKETPEWAELDSATRDLLKAREHVERH